MSTVSELSYCMAGIFGRELNLADWRLDKPTAKLNSTKFLSQVSNRSPKHPGTRRKSVDVVDRSQGKRKLVPSGLDYGIIQVCLSSGTHECPLSHRDTSLRLIASMCSCRHDVLVCTAIWSNPPNLIPANFSGHMVCIVDKLMVYRRRGWDIRTRWRGWRRRWWASQRRVGWRGRRGSSRGGHLCC